MKSKMKVYLIFCISTVIIGICIIFPLYLFKIYDHSILGKVNLETIEISENSYLETITMMDKLKMLKGNVIGIGIDTGNRFDSQTIEKQCETEVGILQEQGVFSELPQDITWTKSSATPTLVMTREENAKSMVLWDVILQNKDFILQCRLDDSSGKILGFYFTKISQKKSFDALAQAEQISGMAEYLNMNLSAIRPERLTNIPFIYHAENLKIRVGSSDSTESINIPYKDLNDNDSIMGGLEYIFEQDGEEISYFIINTQYGYCFR